MILQRGSENKKEKEKTNTYNFQGQSARSRRWFDLYRDWLKETFRTRGIELYRTV